jgi:hypothetical protein
VTILGSPGECGRVRCSRHGSRASFAAGAPPTDARALAFGRERAVGALLSARSEFPVRVVKMLLGRGKEVSCYRVIELLLVPHKQRQRPSLQHLRGERSRRRSGVRTAAGCTKQHRAPVDPICPGRACRLRW